MVSLSGSADSGSSASDTINVAISSVNDAPTLDNSGTMSLTNIPRDTANPAGNSVDSIIGSSAANSSDAVTDPDTGADEGLAVIGYDNTNGNCSFSSNSHAATPSCFYSIHGLNIEVHSNRNLSGELQFCNANSEP